MTQSGDTTAQQIDDDKAIGDVFPGSKRRRLPGDRMTLPPPSIKVSELIDPILYRSRRATLDMTVVHCDPSSTQINALEFGSSSTNRLKSLPRISCVVVNSSPTTAI
ncbi:hypothetical protein M6B38_342970 [Iris pallida]|uniref:Uncharacterized protein n=1 Tax=Iris pallida TaxID=29817 RepID=A0AAX6GL75_IRIPA|nr:hypothetical protein M6B38_358015 [Iris pallida]KAJ6833049.1 hypothetical protein M6B38_342970 [Iris pallida]